MEDDKEAGGEDDHADGHKEKDTQLDGDRKDEIEVRPMGCPMHKRLAFVLSHKLSCTHHTSQVAKM